MGEFRVRALDAATWDAFASLVEENGGVFGGCWCMGFHPEARDRTPGRDKREEKRQRVLAGTAHAALVFEGDDCVGWVQFGAPAEVPLIKNRAQYERDAGARADWRITCHFAGRGHRRQGVSAAGLHGALELIAGLGGGVVEGYPEAADAVSAGFLYNGALSTFEAAGFERDRMIGKHRWVVRRTVDATGTA